MTTIAVADTNPSKSVNDPLASHLIPETISDRRYENEGRTQSYRRGKLLGKVNLCDYSSFVVLLLMWTVGL